MDEHQTSSDGNAELQPRVSGPMAERRASHERYSTGGLARWTRAFATHPWRVIGAWIGIIATLIVLVGTVGGELRDEFEIPGSDTQRATDLIEAEFASEQGGVLNVVFAAPEGESLEAPENRAAIEEALARLQSDEFKPTGKDPEGEAGLESVGDPFADDTVSDDGRIAYTEAQFDRIIFEEDREAVLAVQDAVREEAEPAGLTVEFNGDAEFPPVEQGTSEALGLLAAIIVLLIVFRTFVAASIPIALALTAVASAFFLLYILAGLTDVNTITPILVSMIGLGVGIDYSLFIVTRFRQFLHDGLPPREAAAEAGATAGRAVLFAGLTVAISVSGLAFFGLDFITKLGIGSALGVLTTVLIANSFLLAVLALLGHKIDRLKVPFLRRVSESEAEREKTLIARWGRFVTSHARAVFAVTLLLILALASTSLLVRLGAADQGTQPTAQTARRAYDLLAEGFGAGFNSPIPIVIDVNDDPDAPQRIFDGVQNLEGVASVGEPQFNDEETVAIVFVTPDSAPQDEETDQLVDRLRGDVVPSATAGGDAVAYVSGLSAAFKDIADRIYERLPFFLIYIVGVTLIILAMAFRSIVISATAAVTTLMSAFVGFGVLTLVVQEGHLLGLTGLDRTGPIETFVPPIAFAILFGLSMDYMVFLMSRIREEHVHGLRCREAVEHGIAAIGRVVVAAALIMGTVFAAFILSADRIPKEFGLLLAVAILTDALVIRMTLVPAFLTMLGERAWYIPGWLDRLLPDVFIEPPWEHDAAVPVPAEPAEVAARS
jgi:RND superfamily putative drug exporter